VIAGGGIIGVSLALGLSKHGARVMVLDRGQPGREASRAAAGMLAAGDLETPAALRPLALASAALYREFAHELEDESGLHVDLRTDGTIYLSPHPVAPLPAGWSGIAEQELRELEPAVALSGRHAYLLAEQTVDPRALIAAALQAAKHRGIEVSSGSAVEQMVTENDRVTAVRTSRTSFSAAVAVNCCGAWAGEIAPRKFPARPVKGQMLAVVAEGKLLRHVVRSPEVYIVPRSDGRLLVGATVEEAGFDKRVQAETVQRLHQLAAKLVPQVGEARMLEAWAGLRPGTPDGLPILGATGTAGYFVATGHFRNGILLAPITAHIMTNLVRGATPGFDLAAFAPQRFSS